MSLRSEIQTLSAAERAAVSWFNVDLPEVDEARHQRLMAAIRNIVPVEAQGPARIGPWKHGMKWRYQLHEHQNRSRSNGCAVCKGTGQMKIFIDRPAAPCATCQKENPYAAK